ncbi:calcium-responsive transcription factor-like isoform X2 [Crassostrea virginica]
MEDGNIGDEASDEPWDYLFDVKYTSYAGYVTSSLKLAELLEKYEYSTSTRFRCLKSGKHFGKKFEKSGACDPKVRIWDTQNNADPYIRYDGTPFIIMGKKVLECHQGFDRDSKTNQKKQTKSPASDHTFKRKRRLVQSTKKKDCPARIKIRHVVKILNYKVSDKDKPSRKFVPQVKKDLHDNTAELVFQHRFYVSLPLEEVHRNHMKGAASSIMQPMDSRISNYIKKVVTEHGVTSTLKMKLLIEVFLKQSIFPDSPLPPKHNKRFWPSLKDIYNHMAVQFLKLRDSSFDQ